MHIFRPYSARLARGTLLAIHSPALRARYARMRRGAVMDSMGQALAASMVMLAGIFGNVAPMAWAGAVTAFMALAFWVGRSMHIRYREERTPTMLFIAESGISAILPDSRTITLQWEHLSAHEARFRPSLLMPHESTGQREESLGLVLRSEHGQRIYVTRDLDGFPDLLEVLAELDVPLSSAHHLMDGIRSTSHDTLERREW